MANDDDNSEAHATAHGSADSRTPAAAARATTEQPTAPTVPPRAGWEWERDLEAQGHGGVWRRSRLESACYGRSDAQLRAKVRETLTRCRVDTSAVVVEVADCIVTLSGSVPTVAEKVACEELSARVVGVRGVTSMLAVAPSPHALR